MANKTEQNIIALYDSYQTQRTPMANNNSKRSDEIELSLESDKLSLAETQAISLYRNFQRYRIPNRERVIRSVLLGAEMQAKQLQKQRLPAIAATKVAENKTDNDVSWKSWLRSLFVSDSVGGWQTAAVFSIALVVSGVVSIVYVGQEDTAPTVLSGIPQELYEHSQELAQDIGPSSNPQFGFSSTYENYQIAFRSGLLLVELPLLLRADQQNKLQQLVAEASQILNQSSDLVLVQAIDNLLSKLATTIDRDSRIKLIDGFILSVQDNYSTRAIRPLLELGRWLEISLLTTQLDDSAQPRLLKQLIQQGKLIAKQTNSELIGDPVVFTLIQEILLLDVETASTKSGAIELRKKLQQIKAALL